MAGSAMIAIFYFLNRSNYLAGKKIIVAIYLFLSTFLCVLFHNERFLKMVS